SILDFLGRSMSKSAARRNSATVARSVSGKVLAGPRFGLIEQLEARTLLAAAGGAEGLEIALAAEATYLSDLNWASVTSPYSGAKKDQSSGGKPMSIGGVSYAKGVGVHSASEIVYNLGGQYTTFQAYVGIDDSV